MNYSVTDLKSMVREVPDFPKPGVNFKDLTPLYASPEALSQTRWSLSAMLGATFTPGDVDIILAPEARGFILAGWLASFYAAGIVPARKPGKSPPPTIGVSYQLEYGEEKLVCHKDSFKEAKGALIYDDLLATGGTARALASLAATNGVKVAGFCFLAELDFLKGRDVLEASGKYPVISLLHFDS